MQLLTGPLLTIADVMRVHVFNTEKALILNLPYVLITDALAAQAPEYVVAL